jgi:hypothetical protein
VPTKGKVTRKEKAMNMLYSHPVMACYANDNDALIPELWAQEGLAILEENMVE